MSVLLIGTSTLASFFKLIMLLIVFVLILVASYYFTKWYARSGFIKNQSPNIRIVETFPMGPGKQICIIRLGDRYAAIAVCKDTITYLMELSEEQLIFEQRQLPEGDFRDIFGDMLKKKFTKTEKGYDNESMEK